MPYHPIEEYAVVGDLRTVALISKVDASVDYFCFPEFDSPTIFGRLLDANRGGHFSIKPSPRCIGPDGLGTKQFYLPSSNVLVTRFHSASGIGQVTDLMPITADGGLGKLVRKVEAIRGAMELDIECQPAFDYGRRSHQVELELDRVVFRSEKWLSIDLVVISLTQSCCQWLMEERRFPMPDGSHVDHAMVKTTIRLKENTSIIFVLQAGRESTPSMADVEEVIVRTRCFWHDWIGQCSYKGRWREAVERSALVLKLLTYHPTGAIIASPTTSLPEYGASNPGSSEHGTWDYRFAWIRDSAFTVYALLRIGFKEEARSFMRWIEGRCEDLRRRGAPATLQIMYDINGGHPAITGRDQSGQFTCHLDEIILGHWEGYKGRGPVRIGNGAAHQLQLDIYGELMDAIYLCDKWVEPISWQAWQAVREAIIEPVLRHCHHLDHGMWELRDRPRAYVHSRLMVWVALDRAIRLAGKRSLPADLPRWTIGRDTLKEEIMTKGWNLELQSFVQAYPEDDADDSSTASARLDAGVLMMPLVFFLSPTDPMMLATIRRILQSPEDGGLTVNHLVFRQTGDSFDRTEGTFMACSFWLVEAMTRAGKHLPDSDWLPQARRIFEEALGYGNHLGLFGEEVGLDGQALGNFPQALTHLALISAAFNLDRTLDP